MLKKSAQIHTRRRRDLWRSEKGKTEGLGREVREKTGLKKDTDMHMSEGRKVDWRELGRIEEGRLVEITPVMKGGGKKKKTGCCVFDFFPFFDCWTFLFLLTLFCDFWYSCTFLLFFFFEKIFNLIF